MERKKDRETWDIGLCNETVGTVPSGWHRMEIVNLPLSTASMPAVKLIRAWLLAQSLALVLVGAC